MILHINCYSPGRADLYAQTEHGAFDLKVTATFPTVQRAVDHAAATLSGVPIKMDIRPSLAAEIAEFAGGSAQTEAAIAQAFEVDEELINDILSDRGIELCTGCGWWCDADEIDEQGKCEDCTEDAREV